MNTTADFAIQLLQRLPDLVQAGLDITAQVGQGLRMLQTMRDQDRGPTEKEYEALRALNQQAHNDLQSLVAEREREQRQQAGEAVEGEDQQTRAGQDSSARGAG